MDLVLLAVDYLVLDKVYATLFPVREMGQVVRQAGQANLGVLGNASASGELQQVLLLATKESFLSRLPRDNVFRQFTSLWLITWLFGMVLYFAVAGASYVWVYDKQNEKHPRFLKNQVRLEISQSLRALPVMAVYTALCFLVEVRGYSKLYLDIGEHGWFYFFFQFPLFLLVTDCLIYFIHRGLHSKLLYRRLHAAHHRWVIATPYASHAFHPLDGFAQSIPYHLFPFIFPMHKFAYLTLFIFVNIWTVLIHDNEHVTTNPIINGSGCHALHHMFFNCNYGQYTTLWDRIGGSYKQPPSEIMDRDKRLDKQIWNRQLDGIDHMINETEGSDGRQYRDDESKKEN